MSFRNLFEGIGLLVVGFGSIVWYIIKLISCIMVSYFIINMINLRLGLGLTNWYWWATIVVIVSILSKIVFLNNYNANTKYGELVNNYEEKCKEEQELDYMGE